MTSHRAPSVSGARPVPPLLLTRDEAAEACGVSRRSIDRALAAGELPAVNAPGTMGRKGLRIPLRVLEAWIEDRLDEIRRRAS